MSLKMNILAALFLAILFNPSKSQAATISIPQIIKSQQDSIVINEIDAKKAYLNAKKFYSNAKYIALAPFLIGSIGTIIFISLYFKAEKNLEKACIFYNAVGDKEKVEELRKISSKADNLLALVISYGLLRIAFLLFLILAFVSLFGGTLAFSLAIPLAIGITPTIILLDSIIFKTKKTIVE